MATGRRNQTNQKKKAKGETRPSRTLENVLEFPVVDDIPKPPDWLNDGGKEFWNDITPMLYGQRVLTKADLVALSHLCQLHGEIQDGYTRKVKPIAADMTQLRMYLAEFGLTPASRTRVSHTGEEGSRNKFSRNGKKPET